MNEAIAGKALENLRTRVAELEALVDSQAVELREAGQARDAEVERLRTELAQRDQRVDSVREMLADHGSGFIAAGMVLELLDGGAP